MWGHRGRRQLLTAATKYQIVYFWKRCSVPPMFRRPDDISRIFLKTVELELHQRPPSTWCFSLIWSPLVKTHRCGFPSFHCTFLCAAKSTEVGRYKGLFSNSTTLDFDRTAFRTFRCRKVSWWKVEGELVSIVRKVSWCWCWCWCAGR